MVRLFVEGHGAQTLSTLWLSFFGFLRWMWILIERKVFLIKLVYCSLFLWNRSINTVIHFFHFLYFSLFLSFDLLLSNTHLCLKLILYTHTHSRLLNKRRRELFGCIHVMTLTFFFVYNFFFHFKKIQNTFL